MTNENQKFERFYKLSAALSIWKKVLFATLAIVFILGVIHFEFMDLKIYCFISCGIAILECAIGAVLSHKLEHLVYTDEDESILHYDQSVSMYEIVEMFKKAKANHEYQKENLKGKWKKEEDKRYHLCTTAYFDKYRSVLFWEFVKLKESLEKRADELDAETHNELIENFLNLHCEFKDELIKTFGRGSTVATLVETSYNNIYRKCQELFID